LLPQMPRTLSGPRLWKARCRRAGRFHLHSSFSASFLSSATQFPSAFPLPTASTTSFPCRRHLLQACRARLDCGLARLAESEARLQAHEEERTGSCERELELQGAVLRAHLARRDVEVQGMREERAAARRHVSAEAEVVGVEHELLVVEAGRLAEDRRELDGHSREVEGKIEAEAQQECATRVEWLGRAEQAHARVAELRTMLQEAEAAAAECDAKVAACDLEIARVRQRFDKPLTRLSLRHDSVAAAAAAWEKRRAALQGRVQALQDTQRRAAEGWSRRREAVAVLRQQYIDGATRWRQRRRELLLLRRSAWARQEWQRHVEAAEARLSGLRREVAILGEELQASGEAALALQKERASLRHALATTATRAPELQEQKQARHHELLRLLRLLRLLHLLHLRRLLLHFHHFPRSRYPFDFLLQLKYLT
jgi:chromosome segregation ATPase